MMAAYTAGLTLFSAPFALANWHPVPREHLVPLLLVGCFAQSAQLCFLKAHFHGAAGVLSVLSYLSLVLSVAVGVFAFGEIPGPTFAVGAALVVGAALWVTLDRRIVPARARL